MTADVKLMTAEELSALPDDGNRYELVNGELVTMASSFGRHGLIAGELAISLGHHVKMHRLGRLLVADAGYILHRKPDTVRAPDVAFVREGRSIGDAFVSGPPDLAIEVVSSGDRPAGVEAKAREYLRAGSQMVIVIDPSARSATVHTPDGVSVLSIEDTLDGGDVVPGWRLPLRELFEETS